MCVFLCLFVWGVCLLVCLFLNSFSSFSLYSYWDVTNTCERWQIMLYTRPFQSLSSYCFFYVPYLLWNAESVYMRICKNPDTRTCCRVFDNEVVTTCFIDCRCRDSNTNFSLFIFVKTQRLNCSWISIDTKCIF